jgi:NAD-dependent dihydropyrimidine dehydrogenase PreA subunit
MNHQSKRDKKFATWKGIPREKIEWYPTVDKDKCTGCGMCVTSCGRNVFDFDPENNKAVVARPLQCMVGCTSCQVWCIYDAIRFPDPNDIKSLIKKRGVRKLAKKQLDGKIESGENLVKQTNKATFSNK